MNEKKLKIFECTQVRETLQIVFGEIEFDEIEAKWKCGNIESIGCMQDQQSEAVMLRNQLFETDCIFCLI